MFEKLNRVERWIFDGLSLGLVSFYSYAALLDPAATQLHRGIYVVITCVLVFLLYRSRSRLGRICDYLLIAASIACIGYWMWNFEAINYRVGAETELDQWIAMAGVLLGIELARRVVGNVFGEYAPELISHAGDTFPELCTSIFYKSDGVFGIMANVLATYVILFVIFGAYLEKESRQVGDGRAFGNRITCRHRLPRADGRVLQAASVRARYRRVPHASETAFRCRVRPTPLPKALPSAYSGSGHAVPPLPPTGHDAHREAESSMSPRQSSSFSQAPGVTTRKPSKTNSPASISLVLPVKIHAAFPATASSTKWLSDSSRRFGRQRYEMLIHWQAPRTASNSAVRSSGPIGAAANNSSLDKTSSYSKNNALPIRGRAVPVRHLRKTSRAAPSGERIAETRTFVSTTILCTMAC